MSSAIAAICRFLKAAFFAIFVAIALFLIVLSGGRVLDVRIAAAESSSILFAISLVCWSVLLAAVYKVFLGSWQSSDALRFALLSGLLLFPMVYILFTLTPVEEPKLSQAIMVAGCALVASMIADRILGRLRAD